MNAPAVDLRRELAATNARIDAVGGRVHTLLYGIIVAVLVPVLIRIFFP